MSELIDLVDENNVAIGTTDVDMAHKQKQIHRVVGILLFDEDNNLCLQDENDYHKLDLSVGGHVRQGESYDEAAQREMQEELGVKTPLTHITTFLPANAKLGHFWAIYEGQLPYDWVFSPTDEIKSVSKMSLRDVSEKLKTSPEIFTHGFLNVFMEYNRIRSGAK